MAPAAIDGGSVSLALPDHVTGVVVGPSFRIEVLNILIRVRFVSIHVFSSLCVNII